MGAQENRAAGELAVERWNARDDRYFELYAPDAPIHGMPPNVPPTVDGLKAFFRAVWEAFPDIRLEPCESLPKETSTPCSTASPGHTRASSWVPRPRATGWSSTK